MILLHLINIHNLPNHLMEEKPIMIVCRFLIIQAKGFNLRYNATKLYSGPFRKRKFKNSNRFKLILKTISHKATNFNGQSKLMIA